jgi:superfamily II helicase
MTWKSGSWGPEAQSRSIDRAEYFRRYQQSRYQRKKQEICKKVREWQERNEEKVAAEIMAKLQIQIPKGQLCERCGSSPATQRHHPDYSLPLKVEFLCARCHRKVEVKP